MLKTNDIIKLNGKLFAVAETMQTESNECYVLLYSLSQDGGVAVCKEPKEGEVLEQITNDYLLTKLMQNFKEKLRETLPLETTLKRAREIENLHLMGLVQLEG